MIYVDSSAIVAVLAGEPEADAMADALDASAGAITSPMALFEAAQAVCRLRVISLVTAREDVEAFLDEAAIQVVPITSRDAVVAIDAASRYGKGRGHRAQLNFGDCFAYAVARNSGAALLFKGDDFSHTDIRPAATA